MAVRYSDHRHSTYDFRTPVALIIYGRSSQVRTDEVVVCLGQADDVGRCDVAARDDPFAVSNSAWVAGELGYSLVLVGDCKYFELASLVWME